MKNIILTVIAALGFVGVSSAYENLPEIDDIIMEKAGPYFDNFDQKKFDERVYELRQLITACDVAITKETESVRSSFERHGDTRHAGYMHTYIKVLELRRARYEAELEELLLLHYMWRTHQLRQEARQR